MILRNILSSRLAWWLLKGWLHLPPFKGRNWLFFQVRPYFQPKGRQWQGRVRWGGKFLARLDDEIDAELYFFELFDPTLTKLFQHLLRPGDQVVDVGANIGYFTILSGNLVGKDGGIHAFEPNPAIFQRLKHNVQLNDLKAAVQVNNLALGEMAGVLKLYWPDEQRSGDVSFQPTGHDNETVFECRQETLDQYCQARGVQPQLIKIDVEGAEMGVVRGAEAVLETARPLLILEYNSATTARAGYDPSELVSLLSERYGYRFYSIEEGQIEDWKAEGCGPNVLGWQPRLAWQSERVATLQTALRQPGKQLWVNEIWPSARSSKR